MAGQQGQPPDLVEKIVCVAIRQGRDTKSHVSEHLGAMMGDAPFCNLCGHTTVRNGVCYKCLNCGNTLGCS